MKAEDVRRKHRARFDAARLKASVRSNHGFTLFELVIVITIIVILAMIVMPMYNQTIDAAREATLRTNLSEMRKMLDRYATDKSDLPPSLESLVEARYLRELPVDPMTGARDWTPAYGSDPSVSRTASGVTDVHSASNDVGSDGKPYSEW